MTAKEKIECLKKAFEDCDKVLDAIDDAIGIRPEAPLFTAISRLQNITVRATAESIGIEPEVLDWFVIENSFGATGHVCVKDGVEAVIDSIDAFLKFEGVDFDSKRTPICQTAGDAD